MRNIEKVKAIEQDFQQKNGPFADVEFPEERLLRELSVHNGEVWRMSMEDKLCAISLFCTLDYNRDANQLVDKIIELHNEANINPFNAHEVSTTMKGVEYWFDEISFRYKSRDAHAWHKNCSIIVDKYNGKWSELVLDTSCDAPTLVQRLKDDDFNCLKGVKIAPMYARIINDDVCPLSNMWELDIPVDTHIRRLSRDLWDSDLSDDEVRLYWQTAGEEHDVNRAIVDGALWHIGNKWDDWGENYWNEVGQ